MNSKLTLSMTHLQEYVYEFDDTTLTPFSVVFRALSRRDMDFIRGLEKPTENDINIITLEKSLIKFINVKDIHNTPITTPDIELLSITQQSQLSKMIHKVSTLNMDIIDSMRLNSKIALEDNFQTETWQCSECQRRNLDVQRNCKKREDYDEIFNPAFKVLVGTEEFRDCPMFYKDEVLTKAMFECYSTADKGLLPEIGGVVDQTEFYQYGVDFINAEIQKMKAAAYDKNK